MSITLSGHLIDYRAHRYECIRCGARLLSMMQFGGRECPGAKSEGELMSEDTKNCEECGKPEGSFACKIRHQHIDLRWTKGIH